MPTPTFLSFDGLDGTGKSTQCRLLIEWLRARHVPVTHCVDPGGTDLGAKLREILLHSRETTISMRAETLLFMASRAQLVEQVIQPALARGEIVVSDRYLLANVVYQAHAGGLIASELWSIGAFATMGVQPDLTFIFDLPIEVAQTRRGRTADRMESRGDDFFRRVRDGFRYEATLQPNRHLIDASGTTDEVHAKVRELATPFLASRGYSL